MDTAQDSVEKRGDRLLKHLQQLINIETARQQISQQLQGFDRLSLETGAFWKTEDGQKDRADQRLLRAMDQVRRRLLGTLPQGKEAERSEEIVYAFLGRSLFVRYLEDRGILSAEWISRITNSFAFDYLSVLEDKDTTYHLFDYLSQRFNGNLFPVEKEERLWITQTHLGMIQQFLSGNDLEAGQLALWPYYDFTHIPIELISGIYDTFLSDKKRKKLGAYFTPLALVDFMIEETLPREKTRSDTTILDPTCGSGVFLVRAYQRLVEAWKRENQKKPSGESKRSRA
ncbi:MAG TPA: N-6 DNA methylase [Ktedonobacteraceae bacterium]